MPGALEPVQDVGTACVVDLIKGVSVGLLDGHGVAVGQTRDRSYRQWAGSGQATLKSPEGLTWPTAPG